MTGLETARVYYEELVLPMVQSEFPYLESRIAFGLAGEGSECLGFDDEISRDHDFSPSLCLWLTDEDYDKYGFALSRSYDRLSKSRGDIPVGGARRGVLRTSDFYMKHIGTKNAPDTWQKWLSLPTHALATASNGEIFRDDMGEFSAVRGELLKGYPRDIQLKKLSAKLLLMAQSGLYNYPRCLNRGEVGGAAMSLYEFVKHSISAVYLINNKFEPFYKWAIRGISELSVLPHMGEKLTTILSGGGDCGKIQEEICSAVNKCGIVNEDIPDCEALAYMVNEEIKNEEIRNLHILAGE